jgi:hypothetical protein
MVATVFATVSPCTTVERKFLEEQKAIVPEMYVFNILANDRVMAGQRGLPNPSE